MQVDPQKIYSGQMRWGTEIICRRSKQHTNIAIFRV